LRLDILQQLCSVISPCRWIVTFYKMSANQPSTTKCHHPQTETKSALPSHNTYWMKLIVNHR